MALYSFYFLVDSIYHLSNTKVMPTYTISKMTDFSDQQIDQIRLLEKRCASSDASNLRVGIESLKEVHGDEAFLCYNEDQLIGFLSWYTSDRIEANINAMVHPDFRRNGIFRSLLNNALADMHHIDIQHCLFRIPSNSQSGIDCIQHIDADLSHSQFSMTFNSIQDNIACYNHLHLKVAEKKDIAFLVYCFVQAFGDSESWTKEYLENTSKEPTRLTYLALDKSHPVGMIRVNTVQANTAVIHDFCVLPTVQGNGYGRNILAQLITLLQDQQYTEIRLSVVTANRQALSLYQSVGFKISAEFYYYSLPLVSISK